MKAACKTYFIYRTWLGNVCIGANERGICYVSFEDFDVPGARRLATSATNALSTQILEYLAGKRQQFDVTMSLDASMFMLQVWSEVGKIPYGETATATDIAKRLGAEAAYRNVGRAVRSNPMELVIPTHRIVDSTGKPIGTKRQQQHAQALIEFESIHR